MKITRLIEWGLASLSAIALVILAIVLQVIFICTPIVVIILIIKWLFF